MVKRERLFGGDNMTGYLEHHGVKGMHWGVRKETPRSQNRKAIKDRREAYKNRRLLSDEELRARIERLRLEKQFRDLSIDELSVPHQVVRRVNNILDNAGSQALTNITKGGITYGTRVATGEQYNPETLRDFIASKPGGKKK